MKFKLFFVFILISYLGCGGQKNVERRVWVPTERGDIVYLYKDKIAYIIAVGEYRNMPILKNARNDAQDVSLALSELGFKVKIIENPTYFF